MSDIQPVVVKKGRENNDTGQSGGLALITGIGSKTTPASKIWLGKGSNAPGGRSKPHHHAESETACYLLSGKLRLYYGENYSDFIDVNAGDYFFVPANMPHVEANMSMTEELVCLVGRSPGDIVVNLPDIDDALLAGYRRA